MLCHRVELKKKITIPYRFENSCKTTRRLDSCVSPAARTCIPGDRKPHLVQILASDLVPLLPVELEREIFETAAGAYPKCVPRLILVAHRFYEWSAIRLSLLELGKTNSILHPGLSPNFIASSAQRSALPSLLSSTIPMKIRLRVTERLILNVWRHMGTGFATSSYRSAPRIR
jgi:hypothetical protein